MESRRAGSNYLWLCLSATAVTFVGFWFTYFSPMIGRQYPAVSPTVHIHGWTFFLWYLVLPLQAGLIRSKRVAVHRKLGYGSLGLAVAMVFTGLVVIGEQMNLASQPDGSPFWRAMGPTIFLTLVLFAVFYALAIRFRRDRELHKRFMLLASAGGLGAAAFRVVMQILGPGIAAGVVGILLPNVIIISAMALEFRREGGVHRAYRWGLGATVFLEVGILVSTPMVPGRILSDGLAAMGRALGFLY